MLLIIEQNLHWESRRGSVETISSGKLSLGVFFYPLFSSVGSYTTLTSVASSGALSNVTNICQTCGVCLCEYLLGVLQRLGSWLSFVIWKSIKEDFCQIRDFYTLLCINHSRHSLTEAKTSKLRTEKQKYPETCLAWDTWICYVSWGLVENSILWWSKTALTAHILFSYRKKLLEIFHYRSCPKLTILTLHNVGDSSRSHGQLFSDHQAAG